jgi:hypothetical protein
MMFSRMLFAGRWMSTANQCCICGGWNGGPILWQPIRRIYGANSMYPEVILTFCEAPTKSVVSQKALIFSRSPMEVAVARAGCNGPAPPHHPCEYQYIHLTPRLPFLTTPPEKSCDHIASGRPQQNQVVAMEDTDSTLHMEMAPASATGM